MRAAAWRRKQLLVMGMGMGLGMGCTLISDMWRSSSSSNATCNMARDQGTCPAHPWLIGCRAKPFNWTIYGNDSPSRHIISSTWVRGVDFWYFVKWVFLVGFLNLVLGVCTLFCLPQKCWPLRGSLASDSFIRMKYWSWFKVAHF